MMNSKREKLEYAFNSWLDIPLFFEFKDIKPVLNWLNKLQSENIASKILGLLITEKEIRLLVELHRTVSCCGLPAVQSCKIWCFYASKQNCTSVFLNW